ncbi:MULTISPECIES: V-type ATP synthase subunit I [unclassified Ruegeria]|uniref:V-type ATP synthase subunit I n=1 Tax=unclassified Ruegeria TaxID=2625375 RepID=UPI001487B5B1|nr:MULTISPECIES: V-type ATP synthase subunit I [unclassified Ruegeria]NOD86925.1 V-type ATP synthase subunit I [Ruegeria sp. HKCCD4318]NOE12480.1 V-type ATP synthase subunit I [Ruegeria sp. HKCCD4318-2]NOG09355.1 V-type ATP synthase subunit I [Ruegeria sp. HKCCD4315]
MSVARLKKMSLVGPAEHKADTLEALQDLGCMHVLPLVPPPNEPEKISERGAREAYKALRFLAEVPEPRRQIQRDPDFDMDRFVHEVTDLMQRTRGTMDRRDFLAHRIAQVRPWGDLDFPPTDVLAGNRLWFYQLPLKHREALSEVKLPWAILEEDHRFLYAVLISPDEPDDDILPIPRTHVGSLPIHELEAQLEEAEIALEALEAERVAQTRYLTLMRQNLSVAESAAELAHATQKVRDDEAMFAVQGWVPEDRVDAVLELAKAKDAAVLIEEPGPEDNPPTLLEQPEKRSSAVDLALFYQVPGYKDWDPSVIVAASFAFFFAMIVADAGYGAVILLGLLLFWKRMGGTAGQRSWRLYGLIISGATILYGILVGSYFGVAPPEGSVIAKLKVLDLNNFGAMMMVSIVVGVLHLVLANALAARAAWGQRKAIANLGWIAALIGGFVLWLSYMSGKSPVPGSAILILGVVAIVLFSSERIIQKPTDWIWRLIEGVQSLAGAMGAFGDVLSYMRLFALGLASASLAITFNDLAVSVMQALKGPGILFGLLILIIGHVLNFALAMMSGVVHGLRLNYIEFFKWGLPDEGIVFRPFARKEVQE